jgi:hypothetical protein
VDFLFDCDYVCFVLVSMGSDRIVRSMVESMIEPVQSDADG